MPLSKNELQAIDKSVTSIIIPNWTCNDIDYTIFDFSRFSIVKSIVIGNDCFGSVQTFKIDGLNRLKTIKIGNYSFTHAMYHYGNDSSNSFHILNCEALKLIEIGEYSFSDFGGEFELKNLPQLQSIQMGTCSFNYSSFVIRGIEMIMSMYYLGFPNLKLITLEDYTFCESLSTIIESIE